MLIMSNEQLMLSFYHKASEASCRLQRSALKLYLALELLGGFSTVEAGHPNDAVELIMTSVLSGCEPEPKALVLDGEGAVLVLNDARLPHASSFVLTEHLQRPVVRRPCFWQMMARL